MLVLLVRRLHRLEVARVVLEDDRPLGLELLLHRVALQRRLELREQLQRVVGRGDVGERVVDERLCWWCWLGVCRGGGSEEGETGRE